MSRTDQTFFFVARQLVTPPRRCLHWRRGLQLLHRRFRGRSVPTDRAAPPTPCAQKTRDDGILFRKWDGLAWDGSNGVAVGGAGAAETRGRCGAVPALVLLPGAILYTIPLE